MRTTTIKRCILSGTALCIALAVCNAARAALAEPMNVDADVLAKLALNKARRQSTMEHAAPTTNPATTAAGGSVAACGSVDLGTVSTGGRPIHTPVNLTVVVTGDVINANNRCK